MLTSRTMILPLLLVGASFLAGCSEERGQITQTESIASATANSDAHPFGKMIPYEAMASELGLTADQQNQLKAIHEKYRARFTEARESADESLSRKERFAAMKPLFEAQKAELEAVLTEAQLARFKELRQEKMIAMKDRFAATKDERIDRHVGFLARQLDLTDQQQTDIKVALTSLAANAPDEPGAMRNRDAWKAHFTQAMEAIKPILTADQLQKLDEMKSNFRGHRGEKGRGLKT